MFVDRAQIHAKAGDGGAGAASFRREAHVSRGGPDGGDGGDGGDVWLVAGTDTASLLSFRDHPHRRAGDGAHGRGKNMHGARGDDLLVPVPVGTAVLERDGSVLADLATPGARFRAAEGGKGGRGNARFLSNRRRAPAFAEQGEHGEERWLDLELKLAADVAIIGFPNAGKSTLISVISAAKPKIADYPFTTLVPNLGVVRVPSDDQREGEVEMVVADIPGLVEGASAGRGLGQKFLRHVERARVLLVLCDLAPTDPESPSAPPGAQLSTLLAELEKYRPELLERPRLVVGSKCDAAFFDPSDAVLDFSMSAVTGEGRERLVRNLASIVSEARRSAPKPSGVEVVHRIEAAGVRVERIGEGSFEVIGREALRAVRVNDLEAPGAAEHVAGALKRAGVERALARAGARSGDHVKVGDFHFVYEPD